MSDPPSNETPEIFLAVCKLLAVSALPVSAPVIDVMLAASPYMVCQRMRLLPKSNELSALGNTF